MTVGFDALDEKNTNENRHQMRRLDLTPNLNVLSYFDA